MVIDNPETKFNENISKIINSKINDINTFSSMLPSILGGSPILRKRDFCQLTDENLLYEIYHHFGDNCISERTFKSIKAGSLCSSALNICYVIHTINFIIEDINKELVKYNSAYDLISKIDLNRLFIINK